VTADRLVVPVTIGLLLVVAVALATAAYGVIRTIPLRTRAG
jgi:hypothetical protein